MSERRDDGTGAHRASRRRKGRKARSLVAAGVTAVLVVSGGGLAYAVTRSDAASYRFATAELGTVAQTVSATGTLASASRADVAFQVAGTVGSVAVSVGDEVTAGQVLASLDVTALDDAVDAAESTLADAQQALEDDIDAQTAAASSSSSASSASSTSSASSSQTTSAGASAASAAGAAAATGGSSTGGSTAGGAGSATGGQGGSSGGQASSAGGTASLTAARAAITSAQQSLLQQYTVATAALVTAQTSLATAHDLCADVVGSTDATTTPTTAQVTACQDALATVQTDQAAVDAAQSALMELVTALDSAVGAYGSTADSVLASLTAAAAAPSGSSTSGGTTGSTTAGSTTAGSTTAGSTQSTPLVVTSTATTSVLVSAATGGASGSTSAGVAGAGQSTSVPTAADLLADQAAIDAAQATVAIATAARARDTITSPIAGTVAAVAITVGDEVTAASTTSVVTVIGLDGFVVSMSVPLAQIEDVAVGQAATVEAPSTSEPLAGVVSSIGVLDVSSTSEPEYTVDVAITDTDALLFNGASADVTIEVAGTDRTLTVPTSAVHRDSGVSTVQRVVDGVLTDVTVTVGAIGAERTEIVDGLAEGDQVVLADLHAAIDSGSDSSSSGLTGLTSDSESSTTTIPGGDFPDGGFPGGGMPGGGAPPQG